MLFFLSPNSIKVNYPMHVCVTKTQHSFLIKMCWRHFKYNHSTDTLKEYKTSVIEHHEIHSWVPDEQLNLEYCFVNIENSWLWYYFYYYLILQKTKKVKNSETKLFLSFK